MTVTPFTFLKKVEPPAHDRQGLGVSIHDDSLETTDVYHTQVADCKSA